MSGKTLAFILFLALAIALAFPASCPVAQRDIYLAAVTGENTGGVFQLHVEVKPGSGSTYTSVNPRTGLSTQESEDTAATYAFSSTGVDKRQCDVLLSMNGDFGGNSVDGPSAGGAMTAAMIAALTNRTIRQDVVMTGTISPDGKVGAVGGIIEKGKGAADAGAKYFITPKLMVHEAILLAALSKNRDFHAIDVENLSQAEAILFSNYSANFSSNFTPDSKPLPAGLPSLKMDADLGRFALLSKKVVGELQAKVAQAYPSGSDTPETSQLHSYFNKETAKYNSLIPMGYVFTAANSAFLLSIDVEYAKIGDATVDLAGSISDVKNCISSLPVANKTRENLHWAIGSDLRRIWATERLNQTLEARADQGGYTTLRDLLFSNSWCGISRGLASQADDVGGEPVDESKLAPLANKELLSAKEAFSGSKKSDYDALWHLQNAEWANSTGQYGASIYESAYARVMQEAASGNIENVSDAAKRLSSEQRTSLWGKIYQGHGQYLYYDAQSGGFPPDDAYRIMAYAKELDRVSSEMDAALAAPSGSSENAVPASAGQNAGKPQQSPWNAIAGQIATIALALCLVAASLAVIHRFHRMKKRLVK